MTHVDQNWNSILQGLVSIDQVVEQLIIDEGAAMISFLYKKRNNQAVAGSKLCDETTFYKAFEKDLRKACKLVVIESPFMTERRAYQLSRIFKKLTGRGVSVRVYTRNPYHHPPRLRDQSFRAIAILKASGAKVYGCDDMRHRKVAIFDKRILWEGSLNILSQSKSRETMRRIESAQLARQMLAIVKS